MSLYVLQYVGTLLVLVPRRTGRVYQQEDIHSLNTVRCPT